MRLSKLAFLAAICGGALAGGSASVPTVWGQMPGENSFSSAIPPESFCDCGLNDCGCDSAMPMCGCGDGSCDGGCSSTVSCEDSCGGGLFDTGCLGDCNLGDPFSLLGECCGYKMGGWASIGYHDANLPLFNNRKNEVQLHQGWIYAEKEIDTSGGFDLGGRIDYIYGTDGPDTQAFGIDNTHWDNQWDNGSDYGHALPQVYLEAGYGDLSIKAGHFYTIIGYEVVQATGNFFYSHAYTFYNSEPFTHTGALVTYDMSEDIDIFGGYVMGWDSGFEDNGDAFLGGSSIQLTDDVNVISTLVAGRFADNSGGDERGFMSSTVAQVQLTEKLAYIFQTDLLDTEDRSGATVRETFGINQYLIHSISDCIQFGGRFEWWNVEADSQGFYGANAPAGLGEIAGGDYDIFAMTLGANFRPHANVVVRPEIRWDWVDGETDNLAIADFEILENNDDRQTTFGVDTVFTY